MQFKTIEELLTDIENLPKDQSKIKNIIITGSDSAIVQRSLFKIIEKYVQVFGYDPLNGLLYFDISEKNPNKEYISWKDIHSGDLKNIITATLRMDPFLVAVENLKKEDVVGMVGIAQDMNICGKSLVITLDSSVVDFSENDTLLQSAFDIIKI